MKDVNGSIRSLQLILLCPSFPQNFSKASDYLFVHHTFIISGVITSVVIIIGCFNNISSIVVFLRPALRNIFNYYLVVLACWDLLLLISAWFTFSLSPLIFNSAPIYGKWTPAFQVGYVISNTSFVATIWISMALTVERYLAICYPLQTKTFNNRNRIKLVMMTVSLLAIVFCLPRCFEITTTRCKHPQTMVEYNLIIPSMWIKNRYYLTYYRVLGGATFTSLFPFMLITILTIQMTVRVRNASKALYKFSHATASVKGSGTASVSRLNLISPSNNQVNSSITTTVLIVIQLKFIICYTLPTVIDLIDLVSLTCQHSCVTHKFKPYLITISNLLVVIHSATNFYVTLIFGRKFRRELINLLRRQQSPASNVIGGGGSISLQQSNLLIQKRLSNNNNNTTTSTSNSQCALTKKRNSSEAYLADHSTLFRDKDKAVYLKRNSTMAVLPIFN